MKTTNPRVNLCLLTCVIAAWLAWLPNSSAQTTNIIYNDTFDDGAGGLATRADDAGANYGLDIQWRPRVSSQAGSYSVASDTVFGPSLKFHNTANNLWIIGQFDNDASDGVTFGGSSVPVSLGGNAGDVLIFSMRIRTSSTISSGMFKCGYTLVPGGPRADDGSTDNTWVNLCTGYFIIMNNGTAGQVATCKQTGVTGVTPFGGAAQTTLTTGIAGVNAAIGADTLGHTFTMQLMRVSPVSVRIDSYWDGTLVATATDSTSPYTQFNSAMILYGAVTDYMLDDVTLLSTSVSLGYQPPLAVNDAYSVAKNGVLTVAAPGVLGNDSAYTNAPMTATNLTLPTHGTLTSFNNNGAFVYTPNSNFFGTDSFTYQAYDAVSNSQTATVTLNVVGYDTWTGAASASWVNLGNWASGDAPTGQNVRYDNTSANLTQTLDQSWSVAGLIVSNVSGPVTIANGFTLTNSGPINLANASADLAILADYAPSSASPTTIGAGRTVTVSNVLGSLNNAAGPGTLRVRGSMTGALLDVTGSLTLLLDGASVTGSPPVRLTAEAGGTVRAIMTNNSVVELTGNSSKINVGNNGTTNGMNIFTLASGTLKIGATTAAATTANANNGIFVPNNNCFGVFNLNGGTVIMTNKQTASTNTVSETTLRIPGNAAGNGVANLNGGQMFTPQMDGVTLSTGSGVLNFNGSTIIANRSNNTWIAGIQNAYVLSGGAIFDTSTYDVTIPQYLSPPPVGVSGGLTKRGSGILHLTGFNTYTGPTIVAEGMLAVPAVYGAYPTGSALVASNGATIYLDVSSGSSQLMPALTAAGATFTLNYGTLFGNPGAAAINSASSTGVALNATGTNLINIVGSGFAAGDIPLIDYSGSIGGSGFSALKLGSLPLGLNGTLINDTANTLIVLHLNRAPNTLTWYGDKSANWDTSTANWNNGTMAYTEVGGLGDIATFDDTLSANPNVNLVGALKPVSVMLNNYGANYRFGGGKLSGPGSLSKNGSASLTLATGNDFTGGSFLTNGVIYLGNDAGLGAGPVTFAGATLASDGASARTVTNPVTFTPPPFSVSTAVFGDGVSTGTIALTGPVDWSGSALTLEVKNNLIFSGTLANGGLDTKIGPGTITFQNATDAMTAGNLQVMDGSMIVSSGTLDRAHGGIRVMALDSTLQRAYFGVLAGATVLLDGASINARIGNNTGDPSCTNVMDIAGTLSCTANDTGGAIQIGTNSALAQLNLRSGGLLRINSFTAQGPSSEVDLYGGTLAGTVSQANYMQGLGACYVRSGGVIVNTEGLLSQALSLTIGQPLLDGGGGGGLTKNGQGTLILIGTNTYTGPTTVNAGVLQLSSGQTAPGTVTVADGATLAFAAPVSGFTVPVASASLGNSTGAALSVTFSGTGTPSAPAASIGSLTLNGPLTVNVQVAGVDIGTIPLVSYGSLHGTGTVKGGTLPAGMQGTVTNDASAKMIELIITRVPPAAVVFNDTFEPDGTTAATRNDDAGSGFGLDIQWRPRGNSQASNYAVTNDAVLGNALQFNSGTSQFLFSIGQFDNDAGDGVTFDTNSIPVTLGGTVGESLKLSMDVRTTTVLPSGNAFKAALMMAPNGPTPIDTTTGNTWTANWNGYAVALNNGVSGVVTAFKEYPTYDTSDSLLKTGTNTVNLINASSAMAALGADTNKHTLVLQLTSATNSTVQFDAYWDNTLVFTTLDTNSPPFTNFNSLAISYGQVGTYAYDNVSLSKIKVLPSPVAGADAYSLGANTVLTVAAPGLLGNDNDPSGYPLAAFQVNPPTHGTLSLNSNGGFTYTPATNYSGADSFSYQANNGFVGSPITTVSLSITSSTVVAPLLSASVSGSNLVISGAGGTPGANAYVLSSTNLALGKWTLEATVALDAAGALIYTHAIDPAHPQQFFRVQMP